MELESPQMQEAQRSPAAQRLGTASSSRKRNPPRAASMKAAQPKPPAKRATTGKLQVQLELEATPAHSKEFVLQSREKPEGDPQQENVSVLRGLHKLKIYL
ncbi:hypothetical protein F2Q69_00063213 [Brassica cretica]|uniref:Uncharacterized protein n=1 Tax=Brassica cretica TaxID=69181 RepID=A0A8S9RRK1_BRACR|nr:hypothetical protein F2Q69_00063213 [Brassica cretica]